VLASCVFQDARGYVGGYRDGSTTAVGQRQRWQGAWARPFAFAMCIVCELQGRSGSGWCEAAVRREAQKVASCVGLFFVFRACMGSKAHVYVFLVRL
jgi:hypothetical protein